MSRLKGEHTVKDAIMQMSDGNPGALTVLCDLFDAKGDDAILLYGHLDDMGIYGSDIWIAYNDVCKRKLEAFIKMIPQRDVLRASIAGAKRCV